MIRRGFEAAACIIEQKRGFCLLCIIVCLGALLRLNRLGHYTLWLDETIQYAGSTYPLPQLYTRIFPQEMPLSFFIPKLQNTAGLNGSEFSVRIGSAIAGTALIPTMYAIARRLFHPPSAILAAITIAAVPCFVQYSQEYRIYAYFALFFKLAGLFLLKFIDDHGVMSICLFICFCLLTIFDHFLGVVAVASLIAYGGIAGLIQRPHVPMVLNGTVAASLVIGVGMILTIPMWARFLSDEYVADVGSLFHLHAIQTIFGDDLGIGHGALFWFLLVFATIGFLVAWWRHPRSALYITLCIFAPLVVFSVKGSGRILLSNRYLLF